VAAQIKHNVLALRKTIVSCSNVTLAMDAMN